TALPNLKLAVIGTAAFAAALAGVPELWLLGLAGVISFMGSAAIRRFDGTARAIVPILFAADGPSLASIVPLFALFAKIGSVLYGSGYVLLAFLRTELVESRQWLT